MMTRSGIATQWATRIANGCGRRPDRVSPVWVPTMLTGGRWSGSALYFFSIALPLSIILPSIIII
jgi:hypothetical protein